MSSRSMESWARMKKKRNCYEQQSKKKNYRILTFMSIFYWCCCCYFYYSIALSFWNSAHGDGEWMRETRCSMEDQLVKIVVNVFLIIVK